MQHMIEIIAAENHLFCDIFTRIVIFELGRSELFEKKASGLFLTESLEN